MAALATRFEASTLVAGHPQAPARRNRPASRTGSVERRTTHLGKVVEAG